jgi:hypothetical protein
MIPEASMVGFVNRRAPIVVRRSVTIPPHRERQSRIKSFSQKNGVNEIKYVGC